MQRQSHSRFRKDAGAITVEASFIFPWITLLIVAFLQLNFTLHDGLLSDVSKVLGAFRYEQAKDAYCDTMTGRLLLRELVDAPALGIDETYRKKALTEIDGRVREYFACYALRAGSELSATPTEEVIATRKSADILRAGGKVIQVIGEITE